ncbi:recombinase family protein [Streptomyces sp. NPDC059175]|uniref:recombinase family protein n=1 Tax=Streptomyces sp. NPDC059175 TaxID=3346757 RepID=UPI0036A080BD
MTNIDENFAAGRKVVRCYVYASAAQSRPGVIEQQVQECRALAGSLSTGSLNYRIVQVFQDDGASGWSGPRPGYEQMVAGLERGDADAVLVLREDRLSRNPATQQSYRELSERLGITTYSAQADRFSR